MASLKEPVDLAEYLFKRLHQVGIRSVHGVPGDYNLVALDYLPSVGLDWVGNCNELNAGYAADAYARIKGISALITTFGVGELSAMNAIAGSFSEYVPVIHIVGTPSTISHKNGMLLHHTLGNGDFNVFTTMNRNVSCAVSTLTDPLTAADLIDHAIRECFVQSRPVYITLPTDMVTKKLEGERLKTPIDISFPPNDQAQEDFAVGDILRQLGEAKKPIILVDACAIRHRAVEETQELMVKSGLPTFVSPMGKGAIDETLPNYGGVYAGNGSHPDVQEAVNGSDLVLYIGALKSDFNTAGFTYRTSTLNTIDFHSTYVQVRYSEYHGLRMNGVLRKLGQNLEKQQLAHQPIPKSAGVIPEDEAPNDPTITHTWFWPRLKDWIQEDDIILTETGTSNYGIWETKFKKGCQGISQVLWGSIGYATGAIQGAALAAKETTNARTILFTGDGSFQLTAQELSTMLRKKLNPVIFIICNDGYTIERFIHGMKATYNDIAPWKHTKLPEAFGADSSAFQTYQVRTKQETLDLFKDKDFCNSPKLRLVELYMDKEDAPKTLQMTAEASAKNNSKLE